MARITRIEGIGEEFAQKLQKVGIRTTESLVERGDTRKGVKQIAKQAGISEKLILRWVNQADLLRIKGVGGQ
jgi:predicted RecB family nuclease